MQSVLIVNGTLISEESLKQENILTVDSRIISTGISMPAPPRETTIIDAAGKYIIPGGIDPHVHFALPTPAGPSCDDFHSGSLAAMAGGTTFIMDFVTPAPGQNLIEALSLRRQEAESCLLPYRLHVGLTWYDHTIPSQMQRCVNEEGITSFKAYLAYKGSIGIEYHELEKVMHAAASLNAIVLVHCEEGDLILKKQREFVAAGKTSPLCHALSRPPETEANAVKKVIELCRKTGCRTYIVHTSAAESLQYIRAAKAEGLPLYCETCPQYLLLDESVYRKPLPASLKYVISPPIRGRDDREALWVALHDGTVDVVATDHCPFNTFGQKDKGADNFTLIPNGAGGVEHRLALLYTYGVLTKKISLQQFVALTSANAAKIFGLFPEKGSLLPGSATDLVLLDPDYTSVISANNGMQQCDSDIYEGMPISGKFTVVKTPSL